MWEILLILSGAYVMATCIMWTLAAVLSWGQGECISVNEYDLQELLGDMVSHIDCAIMERDADEVFCSGCYASIKAAREWLDKNDPTWTERRITRMDHDE